MTNIQSNNKDFRSDTMMSRRMALLSVLLASAGGASGFDVSSVNSVPTTSTIHNRNPSRAYPLQPYRRSAQLNSVLTRLQYSDGDDVDTQATVDTTPTVARWLKNWLPSSPVSEEGCDNQQQDVDEYLEFLERRYKRLRSDDTPEKTQPKPFLSWLKEGSPKRHEIAATKQQEEDALYVLGVAGLASEKLLQKHQLTPQEREERAKQRSTTQSTRIEQQSDVITVASVPCPSPQEKPVAMSNTLKSIQNVLLSVESRRRSIVRYQTRMTVALLVGLARGSVSAGKALVGPVRGKQIIRGTISAAYTVMFLLLPLLQSVIETSVIG